MKFSCSFRYFPKLLNSTLFSLVKLQIRIGPRYEKTVIKHDNTCLVYSNFLMEFTLIIKSLGRYRIFVKFSVNCKACRERYRLKEVASLYSEVPHGTAVTVGRRFSVIISETFRERIDSQISSGRDQCACQNLHKSVSH